MSPKRVVLAIVLALGFTGCAAIRPNQTDWTEQLLTAAGFQVEPVATAEELAHLRPLKPRKVVQDRRDDEMRYVYADPDVCTCFYVGRRAAVSEVSDAQGPEGDRGEAGPRFSSSATARNQALISSTSLKASFEMQPGFYEGTISLYEDGGTRRLVLNDGWASFNAQVVPQ